jgi:site-specific DNA recombinase
MNDPEGNDIEYQRGRKNARQQLAKLNQQIEERGQWDILTPLIYAEDVEKAWNDLVPDRKRPVIEVLFEQITLLPAGKGAREFNPETVVTKWRERREE